MPVPHWDARRGTEELMRQTSLCRTSRTWTVDIRPTVKLCDNVQDLGGERGCTCRARGSLAFRFSISRRLESLWRMI